MKITGRTRIFGIIADPIHHVKTPEDMNAILAAWGHDMVVIPIHVPPAGLDDWVRGWRAQENLGGIIATVPHKGAMLAHCDALEGDAARIGAVNAIRRDPGGRLVGAALDGLGLVGGLRTAGLDPRGMDTLLMGAGGAGAAVAFALAEAGVARLTIRNRDMDKARDLAARVVARYPSVPVDCDPEATASRDLIVNTTSLGMKDTDPLPLSDVAFRRGQIVAEAIMSPAETALLALARAAGATIQPGRPMLRSQLELMLAHWGVHPPG